MQPACEPVIHPTGTCFEDVTWEFARRCHENKTLMMASADFFMVHGICLKDDDQRYSHAWIEEGKFAWGPGIIGGQKGFFQTTRAEFHTHYRVQEFTRYGFKDLVALSRANGDVPPPWEEKYRRLCRDYQAKMTEKKA